MRIDQKKRSVSLIEALLSLVVGALINFLATYSLIDILFQNVRFTDGEIAAISTAIFTILSVIRSFSMRRLFNWLDVVTSKESRNE